MTGISSTYGRAINHETHEITKTRSPEFVGFVSFVVL